IAELPGISRMANRAMECNTGPRPHLVSQCELMNGIVQIGLSYLLIMVDQIAPGGALDDDDARIGHRFNDGGDFVTAFDAYIGHVGGVIAELYMRPGIGLWVTGVVNTISTKPERHKAGSTSAVRFAGIWSGTPAG